VAWSLRILLTPLRQGARISGGQADGARIQFTTLGPPGSLLEEGQTLPARLRLKGEFFATLRNRGPAESCPLALVEGQITRTAAQVRFVADEAGLVPAGQDLAAFDSGTPPRVAPDEARLRILGFSFERFEREFALIERCFHDNAIVFLMGCRIAAGPPGEALLKALSVRWSGARIAAISSIGYIDASWQSKPQSKGTRTYPGMRDTQYPNHKVPGGPPRDYEYKKIWNDLERLPWASERSPHVKVAFRGVLLTQKPEPAPVF